jgi:hypothetical protein
MSEQQATIGARWGGSITAERQAELQVYLDRWSAETHHGTHQGPFDGIPLTGADVFWLAVGSVRDQHGTGPNLHLEGANLEGANLRAAHLEGASFREAHLEGADLSEAHLEGADLVLAHLEGASLRGAHLEGADLFGVRLQSADLRSAYFDKASRLNDAVLSGVSFDQVTFDNTNLTGVDWSLVPILGDERTARERRGADGKPKKSAQRLDEYKAGVRANRTLAGILDSQALSDDAARFGYRAEVLQRAVYLRESRLSPYVTSLLLAVLGGYGYRPFRLVYVYVAVLFSYTLVYWWAPHIWHTALHQLSFSDAGLTSLQVVLGHGLPGGQDVPLADPVNLVADSEVGLTVVYGLVFANAVGGRYFRS